MADWGNKDNVRSEGWDVPADAGERRFLPACRCAEAEQTAAKQTWNQLHLQVFSVPFIAICSSLINTIKGIIHPKMNSLYLSATLSRLTYRSAPQRKNTKKTDTEVYRRVLGPP